MRKMLLTPLALVLSSLLLAAAPNQPGLAGSRQPAVGIDTSFGDRFHEAAAALHLRHYQEAIAKINAALAMQPDNKNASILYAARGSAFWEL